MGLISSIFGKKKKDSATQDVKVEVGPHDMTKPVVSAEDREALLSVADTGRPVTMGGGDFTGKSVILVSKLSKNESIVYQGKSYPVITIDRAAIGTYKRVTFISTDPEEVVNERVKPQIRNYAPNMIQKRK